MDDTAKSTYIEEVVEPQYPDPDLQAPEEGFAWRNKITGATYTSPIYLGEIHFIDGKFIDEPIKERVEDYELVEMGRVG